MTPIGRREVWLVDLNPFYWVFIFNFFPQLLKNSVGYVSKT
ncbi:hypothetical protein PCC7424_3408 [Gloeothece citriformis PCC 7424]|uniref:Uncharacterized protein n=1 Tax=Gloeothece citriformis (strain PCC 7424) TaxID=65393 RepID=B7KF87_GLOC7|nr:hypothetical protein PCC7424_3408 [Gloeothece citriformis PCC 7424]